MRLLPRIFTVLMLSSFGLTAMASSNPIQSEAIVLAPTHEKQISFEELPQKVKDFVRTHFSAYDVLKVEKKLRASKNGKLYELDLSKGIDLEFDKNGDWLEIETPRSVGVPEAIIPQGIKAYVNENYPNEIITSIEKKRYGFEIELGNDLDIKFDKQAGFLSIDY